MVVNHVGARVKNRILRSQTFVSILNGYRRYLLAGDNGFCFAKENRKVDYGLIPSWSFPLVPKQRKRSQLLTSVYSYATMFDTNSKHQLGYRRQVYRSSGPMYLPT